MGLDWLVFAKMTIKLPVDYELLDWRERKAVREEYIKLQNNLCYYCNKNLSEEPSSDILQKNINWKLFPEQFLKHPIHLQHDHKSGMTEGAVHAYCNAVMWQYEGR
jgi:hypothetical protein